MVKLKSKADVPSAIQRARELAIEFDRETAKLNEALEATEAVLKDLGLGVRVQVNFPDPEDESPTGWRFLCFDKHGGDWRLLVEVGDDAYPDSIATKILRNASRDVRLEAIEFIPALIEALVEEAQSKLTTVKKKAGAMEKLVAELRPTAQPGGGK